MIEVRQVYVTEVTNTRIFKFVGHTQTMPRTQDPC
jgi:hypothetical protein